MINQPESKQKINVLFCIAEVDPFVKIGGLGDVAGSLPSSIHSASLGSDSDVEIDIRIVIPLHPPLRRLIPEIKDLGTNQLDSGDTHLPVHYYETVHKGIPLYFIDGDPIENSEGVYSTNSAINASKFVFFSMACLRLPDQIGWQPHIIHTNDWHSALTGYALKVSSTFQRSDVKTILSVHNLPYMGQGCQDFLAPYGLPEYPYGLLPSWASSLPLPMAMAVVDRIIAVSPGYAEEIQTPEFGCGLEHLLQSRSRNVTGIINGIDTEQWNPAADPLLETNYSLVDLHLKRNNKLRLQEKFGLSTNPSIPLLGFISRMDHQKGLDLVIEGIESLLDLPWQLIILGSGDANIQSRAVALADRHPNRVKTIIGFDAELAHHIYAGSDIFLMPSLYEPCGISQMISMRYGTVPVARATGGLKDTIQATRPGSPGTGYLFDGKTAEDFARSLEFALHDFDDQPVWQQIQKNGMSVDFSWEASAIKYISEYKMLLRSQKSKSGRSERTSDEN